ncbi:DUF262 domain-containing protein [Acidovorax sp. HDW3]|uniref:GmrSD restriction endonuclease domain-containing protein n=1 Tax=Acidovorax sp. HDW3 TaxID=2714923 RepID=UPI00140EE13B|nr:DUF262 domain-containing protein [Acidovorax sp. HDW3]
MRRNCFHRRSGGGNTHNADTIYTKPVTGRLRIPEYQRPYRWGEQQINALLQDLHEHKKNKHVKTRLFVDRATKHTLLHSTNPCPAAPKPWTPPCSWSSCCAAFRAGARFPRPNCTHSSRAQGLTVTCAPSSASWKR